MCKLCWLSWDSWSKIQMCTLSKMLLSFLLALTKVMYFVVQSLMHVRLCNLMDCSTPAFLVLHSLPVLAKLMLIESAMPSNHLVFCHHLLLPSIFPSIGVFSNELAFHIRWPKHWSFSFSISPSNDYSGLISYRIDWYDLLAVQGTLKSLLYYHSS